MATDGERDGWRLGESRKALERGGWTTGELRLPTDAQTVVWYLYALRQGRRELGICMELDVALLAGHCVDPDRLLSIALESHWRMVRSRAGL